MAFNRKPDIVNGDQDMCLKGAFGKKSVKMEGRINSGTLTFSILVNFRGGPVLVL